VKKVIYQNTLASLLLGLGAIIMPHSTIGAVVSDACSKELLLAYFPQNFVTVTLKKFNVPQDQWDGIAKDLAAKDKDVVKEVEEKAAKLTPNPLKDRSPEQRQAAVKIFRESLSDIFSTVLKAHGVTDDKQVQAMLADIQQQKATNFAKCMEKQKNQFEKEKSAQPQTAPEVQSAPSPAPAEEAKPKDNFLSLGDDSTDKSSGKDDADSDNDENDDDNDLDSESSSKPKTKAAPTSKPKQDSLSAWNDSSHEDVDSDDEDHDHEHESH
jgi:hypothetical protein